MCGSEIEISSHIISNFGEQLVESNDNVQTETFIYYCRSIKYRKIEMCVIFNHNTNLYYIFVIAGCVFWYNIVDLHQDVAVNIITLDIR